MDRNLAIAWRLGRQVERRSLPRDERMLGGVEVGGCSHGLVGRGDDIGAGVDKAAAGWFGSGMTWLSRDLMWSHPTHSLKPGFALFDGDLGFALGSHGDHPGRSSQTRVIGSDLAGDVGQLDAGNHAAVKGHGGRRQIDPGGDLIWGSPSRSGWRPPRRWRPEARWPPQPAPGRCGWRRGELRPAACRAAPGQLSILSARERLARSRPASTSPRRAAASADDSRVVVAMSACTRATRTRSAGSGWSASVRCGLDLPGGQRGCRGEWLTVADRLPVGRLR